MSQVVLSRTVLKMDDSTKDADRIAEGPDVPNQKFLSSLSAEDELKSAHRTEYELTVDHTKLLPAAPKLLPVPYHEPELEHDRVGEGYRVLLFNDEVHSMVEVALQLMKALHCSLEIAGSIMLRAHSNGRTVVTITSRRDAERIAGILREIALLVSVDRL
ncbi:MAG: ATP-dependent Clp protease adaptor ClpS [Candidatus Sumerlaeaceae bacterium]